MLSLNVNVSECEGCVSMCVYGRGCVRAWCVNAHVCECVWVLLNSFRQLFSFQKLWEKDVGRDTQAIAFVWGLDSIETILREVSGIIFTVLLPLRLQLKLYYYFSLNKDCKTIFAMHKGHEIQEGN